MLCEVVHDETGKSSYKMLTLRNRPKMGLINTKIHGDTLVAWLDSGDSVEISLSPVSEDADVKIVDAKVHASHVRVIDLGEGISRFFSDFLECKVRLVREYRGSRGVIHKSHVQTTNHSQLGLADQYPLLIMSQASIDSINEDLRDGGSSELPLERFRPNIIVSRVGAAFEEDKWRMIRMGSAVVEVIGPCTRCTLPNVDLNMGVRDKNNQPWKLIHATRCIDPQQPGKPVVGVHAMFRDQSGHVAVNDVVSVDGLV